MNATHLPPGDLWVFGYGSLMWRPGFEFAEQRRARIFGYHRSLCVWSWVHRGCPRRPGLVLGLDTGGSCLGMAFRVAGESRDAVWEYLCEREMATPVYVPRRVRALTGAGAVDAVTFTVDRGHPQYVGEISFERALQVVRGASGRSGANRDYVLQSARMLETLAVRDLMLRRLASSLA